MNPSSPAVEVDEDAVRHHVGDGGHAHQARAQLVHCLQLHPHAPRGSEVRQLDGVGITNH